MPASQEPRPSSVVVGSVGVVIWNDVQSCPLYQSQTLWLHRNRNGDFSVASGGPRSYRIVSTTASCEAMIGIHLLRRLAVAIWSVAAVRILLNCMILATFVRFELLGREPSYKAKCGEGGWRLLSSR